MLATQIDATLTKYMTAFNAADLDGVMAFFSDDAVYQPGDGRTHRGKAAIRAAFTPQFRGAYGSMQFDEDDRLIDAGKGEVAIRWTCRHDLAGFHSTGVRNRIEETIVRLLLGRRFGWHGVDVFHLGEDGLIHEKYAYGWFGARPYLQALR